RARPPCAPARFGPMGPQRHVVEADDAGCFPATHAATSERCGTAPHRTRGARRRRRAVMKPCILIFGLPRSGTTWIGKLFDSHPDTLYRHEPDSVRRLSMPLFPEKED